MKLSFHLDGCDSLKEKRGRLRGLKDRFGRQPQLAVCEAAHADRLDRSEWWFVATASHPGVVERTLAQVERDVEERVDALVIDVQREWLA